MQANGILKQIATYYVCCILIKNQNIMSGFETTLTDEIKASITKNLPQAVGSALQERLKRLDELEVINKNNVATIAQQKETISELQAKLATYKDFEYKEAELSAKEARINKERNELEIEKLKNQLEVANEGKQFCKDVALSLTRNIEYRNNVFDSVSGPNGTDQYGNPVYATHSKNLTESKTAE
jgi:hypothetical protein